eukprot:113897-Amphidinium_carterae.1
MATITRPSFLLRGPNPPTTIRTPCEPHTSLRSDAGALLLIRRATWLGAQGDDPVQQCDGVIKQTSPTMLPDVSATSP